MAKNTWGWREVPILKAIADADHAGTTVDGLADLESATGLSRRDVEVGMRALLDAEMVEGINVSSFSGADWLNIRLRERGRRSVGTWPSEDVYAEFMRLLDERLAAAAPAERGRLESLRESVQRIGESGAGSLLADLLVRVRSTL